MTPVASATPVGHDDHVAHGTGLLVYGIVAADGDVDLDGMVGVDDVPLQLVSHGRIAAVVGRIALERPPGRRKELLAYSQTLDALARIGAVIPVQFGSVLPDEETVVAEVLAPDEERLHDLLEQLAGRAQFNLRARYLEDVVLAEVVDAEPEIAELRRRTRDLPEDEAYGERVRLGELVARALERKRVEDADHLLEIILRHSAAHVIRPGRSLEHVLDVSLLVDGDHREAFELAMEVLAEAVHERMRLRLVGPTAAYDFVGGDAWA